MLVCLVSLQFVFQKVEVIDLIFHFLGAVPCGLQTVHAEARNDLFNFLLLN